MPTKTRSQTTTTTSHFMLTPQHTMKFINPTRMTKTKKPIIKSKITQKASPMVKHMSKMKNKSVKDKTKADKVMTPVGLARRCIDLSDLKQGDKVLEPFRGSGAFYNQYPAYVDKDYCEIDVGKDFFKYTEHVDAVITNPPYSILNKVIDHIIYTIKPKKFGLLIHCYSTTCPRMRRIKAEGYQMKHIHICQVKGWFNRQNYILWERTSDITCHATLDTDEYLQNNDTLML